MKATKKPNPSSYRISLYIRASTEELSNNPEGTLKNQEERLRQAVKFKNMEGNFGEIVAVYVDRAKSGKDTNRPELQKLLTTIRERKTNLVMVSELSRISRSIKDFSDIWELMQASDCGFYSLRENFDTTTAAGEMVLFTVANIAQFERRQVSERVSANFNARAQRGLFNGGSIPYGYKRIPDKSGYLMIDEDAAEIVRIAFKAFIREGALMAACKWLNEQNKRLKAHKEGGGKKRNGYFTTDNLQAMLRNKIYIGVRHYQQKGEQKETEAVWPPIIDRDEFEQANALLSKNKSCNKNAMVSRYPYILSGFVSCKVCGDRLLGKSAHGRYGKYGYYEHALNTKRGSVVPGLKHRCKPQRIRATDLEPLVWGAITEVMMSEKVAGELLSEALKTHRRNPESKEAERCRQTVFSVDQQLETLAERLSSLPATISPTPIFKQMEKLEGIKNTAQSKLTQLDRAGATVDEPAELKDYRLFLATLREILKVSDCPNTRAYILALADR
jgi:site-specific DNA recombinase